MPASFSPLTLLDAAIDFAIDALSLIPMPPRSFSARFRRYATIRYRHAVTTRLRASISHVWHYRYDADFCRLFFLRAAAALPLRHDATLRCHTLICCC